MEIIIIMVTRRRSIRLRVGVVQSVEVADVA
jgi:hypothetical protein